MTPRHAVEVTCHPTLPRVFAACVVWAGAHPALPATLGHCVLASLLCTVTRGCEAMSAQRNVTQADRSKWARVRSFVIRVRPPRIRAPQTAVDTAPLLLLSRDCATGRAHRQIRDVGHAAWRPWSSLHKHSYSMIVAPRVLSRTSL